jgi:hypothetical protein
MGAVTTSPKNRTLYFLKLPVRTHQTSALRLPLKRCWGKICSRLEMAKAHTLRIARAP